MINRIKQLRLEKGLSQRKLAEETGISQQSLSFYEKGDRRPKIETWQKLADYFDVPIPYLQGFQDKNGVYRFYFTNVDDKSKKCISEEEQEELIDLEIQISNVYASNIENHKIKAEFKEELKNIIKKYADKTDIKSTDLENFASNLKGNYNQDKQ